MWQLIGPAGTITIILVILIISGVKILKEYERRVIFRLGRMVAPRGPGITYVIPVIEQMIIRNLMDYKKIEPETIR